MNRCTPELTLLSGRTTPPEDAVRYANARIVNLASIFLQFTPRAVTKDVLEEIVSEYGLSRERAFSECFAASLEVGGGRTERAFLGDYIVPMIHELDPAVFEHDPYCEAIRIPEGKRGEWELTTEALAPCEAFVCDDFDVRPDGRMIPQLGFFMRTYRYPALLENGREWMTLMPNETVTTLPAVERARGRVLTYGLGLGYFPFRAAAKPEVESVTVVERSEDVIGLFSDLLLPQFPFREKIAVVCADAFEFAKSRAPREKYDFVFTDVWHDVGDGKELYLRMKALESLSPDTEYAYWIEKTIRCYLARELWPPV